ncbi:unnamed protein product [Rhodiola kirilowii]
MASSSSHGEDANATRSSSSGGGGVAAGAILKKGPWTAAEDAILIEYVNKNGEGNWNAVQRNSGLQRCGKSCRLRWANHLRPNLKKGSFSPDEERLILELHAKYGNKWARMASQMPGRTDNEIKNYWNTRMKRHQRAGLAIYPSDILSGELHHQISHRQHRLPRHRKHHHHHHALKSTSQTQMLDFQNQRTISFDPPTSQSQSQPQPFLFTTHHHQTLNLNPIPSDHHHQFNFFTEQSNRSYQPVFNPLLSNSVPHQPLQFNSMKQELDSRSSEFGFVQLLSSDLPMQSAVIGNHNGGSGMLDDVLNAAQFETIGNEKEKDSDVQSDHQLLQPLKKMKDSPANDEGCRPPLSLKDCNVTTPENSSSGLTSIGLRMEEPVVEINPLDDELTSLLDSFPSASPTPQWYRRGPTMTDVNDSSASDARGGVVLHDFTTHHQLMRSPAAEVAGNGDIDQVLSLGESTSTSWHNLQPTIY